MIGKDKEYWRQLCEHAANEQDPNKLLELAKEIVRILDEKEERLRHANKPANSAPN
jgi:hypothetical protein